MGEIIEYILVEEIDPNIELNISYKHFDKNIKMKNRWKIKARRDVTESKIIELLKNLSNDKLIINENEDTLVINENEEYLTDDSKKKLTIFVFYKNKCDFYKFIFNNLA